MQNMISISNTNTNNNNNNNNPLNTNNTNLLNITSYNQNICTNSKYFFPNFVYLFKILFFI